MLDRYIRKKIVDHYVMDDTNKYRRKAVFLSTKWKGYT